MWSPGRHVNHLPWSCITNSMPTGDTGSCFHHFSSMSSCFNFQPEKMHVDRIWPYGYVSKSWGRDTCRTGMNWSSEWNLFRRSDLQPERCITFAAWLWDRHGDVVDVFLQDLSIVGVLNHFHDHIFMSSNIHVLLPFSFLINLSTINEYNSTMHKKDRSRRVECNSIHAYFPFSTMLKGVWYCKGLFNLTICWSRKIDKPYAVCSSLICSFDQCVLRMVCQ